MMNRTQLLLVLPVSWIAFSAHGDMVMPDFADVPNGWTTDRYEPSSFSNVGTYQGRDNVLGISITSAGNLANRPAAYQSSFYNTQGRQHAVNGGAGSVLSADLYIPAAWADPANGNVRTDIWGVMSGGAGLAYPILGFSNYGGSARLRAWDADAAGGWVNLASSINYGAWNTLAVEFTGSSFRFSVNGSTAYEDSTTGGATGVSAVIMQAYNFADPSVAPGAVLADYTAYWANTPAVPEPSTYLAGVLLLLPFGPGLIRRLCPKKAA